MPHHYQNLSSLLWTVRPVGDVSIVPAAIRNKGGGIPATIPGCIHTDLMDAGLIPDPTIGQNELGTQWVSHADWRYECEFQADPALFAHDEIDLVFDCLDTIAIIELNGDVVGSAASEFIPHRFSILGLLKPGGGGNRLAVTFKSPLRHIHEEAARLGARPVNGDWDPFVFIRKCASNFRWDWGPRVATCGITAPVRLEGRSGLPPPPPPPRPPVARLITDNTGALAFEIDGKRAFCKGVNWIPEGLWPRDRTPERIRQRLQQIIDCGCNMIRVWGGGRYEPDWFYDLCDELGLMVWQDFMFSCGMYPEEEPLRSLVEAEARHQVARLSRHPCVVLWCGGNECIWGHEAWGWKERLKPDQSWGRGYWLDLLPRIVNELDPTRPYWPNSPWSGDEATPANDPSRGDRHTWDAKADGYRTTAPRFCSEFGHQSPANYATLASVLKPEDLRIGSPALEHRQRGTGGTAKHIDDTLAEYFRLPRGGGFDEWHFLAQLMQARALSTGIEWLRANGDQCSGALIWQANDAWPCLSWSLIDSDGREKLAWYAVRRSFRPQLLTFQPLSGELSLAAIDGWTGNVKVRRLSFDGAELASQSVTFDARGSAEPVRTVKLDSAIARPRDLSSEFIVADGDGHRATWFFAKDKDLAYPRPEMDVTTAPSAAGLTLTIRAKSFIRDLCIQPDRIDPACTTRSEQPLTLLPGESATFLLNGPVGQASRLPTLSFPILCCANSFGAPFTP